VKTITAGNAFIEELERTAARGVAFESEEGTPGIACVAAAIRDPFDEPVAAISVTGSATRFEARRYADAVRLSAFAISRELQRSGRHTQTIQT
jgi:DNA-binding IclR family transcriptional regulator